MKNLVIEITSYKADRMTKAEMIREFAKMINENTDDQLNHLGFKEYGENINFQILEMQDGKIA